MLAAHPPFEGDDDGVLMQAIKEGTPDPIDSLPPLVNAALLKGLSKNKDDRFGTCRDFVESLAGQMAEPDLWASAQLPVMAAPIVETISAIPAPQVAASDLPPLPADILSLEGRISGLRVAIDSIDQGRHHDLRAAWKALDGRTTPKGQPVIGSLRAEIEKKPSRRDSELCALAPEAPQRAMLVVINGFKRLVELKRECAAAEQQLRTRQEEDFRGIVERFLARSDDETFPLPAWMKLEPMLAVRRYVFVANLRELLQKAEHHFAAICDERKAERLRLEREREQQRRQQEADERRRKQEREQSRRQREKQLQEIREIALNLIGSAVLGALAIGLLGSIIGAFSWQRVVTVVVGAGLVVGALAFLGSSNDSDQSGGCGCFIVIGLIGLGIFASNGGFSYWTSAGGSSGEAVTYGLWGAIIGLVVGPVVRFGLGALDNL
jgi:F0F1-type ATP synthase assembly protein I